MAFGVLAGQITVIFLEVLLGYVGARSGIIKDRDSKFLSDFIMKLLLPCTMLAGAAVDGEPELLTQASSLVGHDALRGGYDRNTKTTQHTGQLIGTHVHTQTGLGHTAQTGDDLLLAGVVLQGDVNGPLGTVVHDLTPRVT